MGVKKEIVVGKTVYNTKLGIAQIRSITKETRYEEARANVKFDEGQIRQYRFSELTSASKKVNFDFFTPEDNLEEPEEMSRAIY